MSRGPSRGQVGRGRSAFFASMAMAMAMAMAAAEMVSGCATARQVPESVERPLPTTPSAPARPPGIAIDPVLELPRPAASAEPVSGLAVLLEPVDPEPARRVVRAFFEAVVEESMVDLERLVERGAHTRPNIKTRAEPALPWWQRRFERLDYTALGAEVFYRRADMEARTARDGGPPRRPLPANPRGDEVVVRVVVSGQAADKLFGSELVFLLKKTKAPDPHFDSPARPGASPDDPGRATVAGYKIAELFEDFRLP
jgi:hypothetical protein